MLTIKPGRCLAPFSSANTNLTRTTSPRLQLVIRGILWIVPKVRQHGISAFIERDQIGSRELVDQIVFQARLHGFPRATPEKSFGGKFWKRFRVGWKTILARRFWVAVLFSLNNGAVPVPRTLGNI